MKRYEGSWQDANVKEIRSAYRKLALKCYPSKFQRHADAAKVLVQQLQRIPQAEAGVWCSFVTAMPAGMGIRLHHGIKKTLPLRRSRALPLPPLLRN